MQGYKAVKDFTYCECQEFLRKNPSSPNAKQVSERRDYLYSVLKNEDDDLFRSAKTIADYENYIKAYPKDCYSGLHCEEALLRIDNLFFDKNKNTKKGCRIYLERFPIGTHANEASTLIKKYNRSRNIIIILSIVLLLIITGIVCYVNYHPASYVNITGAKDISQYGDRMELQISSDAAHGAISASSTESWISVENYNDSRVEISVLPNENSARSGQVTVTAYTTFFNNYTSSISKTYVINQSSGKATYMNLSTSSLQYDKYGNAEEKSSFTLKCDGVKQTVSSEQNWITVTKSSGSTKTNSSYSVTIDKNNGDSRNGRIVIASQPYNKVITIYQMSGLASEFSIDKHDIVCENASGLDEGYCYRVSVSTDGVSWSASGPSWVELKENTSSLEIVPKPNDGKIRTGTIYVRSNNNHTEEISIKQNGEPSNLSVSPSTWRPGTSSTNKLFEISNDSYYRVSARSDESWLSTSVSGNNVRVYCSSNSSSPRYGTVDIRCGSSTCKITVKQDGYKDCSRCNGNKQVVCDNPNAQPRYYPFYGVTKHQVNSPTQYWNGFMWVTNYNNWVDCSKCGGDGLIKCPSCDGRGKYVTSY